MLEVLFALAVVAALGIAALVLYSVASRSSTNGRIVQNANSTIDLVRKAFAGQSDYGPTLWSGLSEIIRPLLPKNQVLASGDILIGGGAMIYISNVPASYLAAPQNIPNMYVIVSNLPSSACIPLMTGLAGIMQAYTQAKDGSWVSNSNLIGTEILRTTDVAQGVCKNPTDLMRIYMHVR